MDKLIIILCMLISGILSAQTLQTFAGTGIQGFKNGHISEAQFSDIEQLTVDKEGNVYVCDTGNNVIRKIDKDGMVSTFAGSGIEGDSIGDKETARFNKPSGIAIADDGSFYVVDKNNFKIKKITIDGKVELVAGSGIQGFSDGASESSAFSFPTQICVDSNNNLYVADNNNHRIRVIEQDLSTVSTYAGNDFNLLRDGTGSEASFNYPQGIAIDQEDNIYVGDIDNHAIRKITPEQKVTTLAGYGLEGYSDGPGDLATFSGPKGVAVDTLGNIYVADRLNFLVRKIDPSGNVTTIAGTPGRSGNKDGKFSDGNLIGRAVSVAVLPDQSILVSDWFNHTIRRIEMDNINSTKSVAEISENHSIKFSPNPASEFLWIDGILGQSFQVQLIDTNGQVMKSCSNKRFLELQDIPDGVYIIHIFAREYFNTQKIVIANN